MLIDNTALINFIGIRKSLVHLKKKKKRRFLLMEGVSAVE